MPAPINTYQSLSQILDGVPTPEPMPHEALGQGVEMTPTAAKAPTAMELKLRSLVQAGKEKVAALDRTRAAIAAQTGAVQAYEDAAANSWVGKANLDPDSALGTGLNLLAGVLAGGSRQVVGATAALPYSVTAGAADASLSQEDTDAYNNYVQGKATPLDMLRLNSHRNLDGQVGTFVGAKASMSANSGPTVLELAQKANSARQVAREINKTFDIDSIEHQGQKTQLSDDLASSFAKDLASFKTGAQSFRKGDYVDAAGSILSGLGGLASNAAKAAVDHPLGAAQYVSENAAQLGMGALGFAGKAGMTASNIGYAADYYQQGIENFQAKNGGKLPDVSERREIAAWAASLALAEQLGDHVGSSAMKAVKASEKAGMAAGLKNTLRATLEGGITETATEGYQSYAEKVASGERKADDFSDAALTDIYQGAVIGGLSGGALSGGVHGLARVAGATEEQVANKQAAAQTRVDFANAVQNNTPEVFLDAKAKNYSPSLALGVLFAQNQNTELDQPTRLANVQKAAAIVSQLDTRADELSEIIKSGSKEEAKAARIELKAINAHAEAAQPVLDNISQEYFKSITPQNAVEQINAPADQADPGLIEHVINLSMANANQLTHEEADSLASNMDNGLTDSQRQFLRKFSEARQLENKLSTMRKVSQEILHGSPKNIGITQYRSRIGLALEQGDEAEATRNLNMLSAFDADHNAKAVAAAQAWSQGVGTQIAKIGAQWKVLPKGTLTQKELGENGGLALNALHLVQEMQTEAKALSAATSEMGQAVGMRFAPQAPVTQTAPAVQAAPASVQSTAPAEQMQATPATATPLPSDAAPQTQTQAGTQENILPKESGKEETRLETEAPETVVEKPQSTEENADISASSNLTETSDTQVDTLGLAAQRTAEGTTKSYQERNLVADFFKQVAGSEDGTKRPLALVKDFLSTVNANPSSIFQFLKEDITPIKENEDPRNIALTTFVNTANAWQSAITSFLTKRTAKDSAYRYNDLMQFLLNEQGDLPENVKTAISYAAYSYVADRSAQSRSNTKKDINSILGRSKETDISNTEWDVLGHVGAREFVLVADLGRRALQALGLKANKDAPSNLQPQLEAAMGAYVAKLLTDKGILVRSVISGEKMRALTGKDSTDVNVDHEFLALNKNPESTGFALVEKISQSVKGSKGILDKLFGVESNLKAPTTTPVPFSQKTTDTGMRVPAVLQKMLDAENAKPNRVNEDLHHLLSLVSREQALVMAGVKEIDGTVHKINQKGMQAKNEGLAREYDRMMEFFKGMKDIKQPIFFQHDAWLQQRVGILNNVLNPQTSKMQRHMLYRPSWETTIDVNDTEQVNNFLLRVAEGLGVKTDKQANTNSLIQVQDILSQEAFRPAIDALRKVVTRQELSEADKEAILHGVGEGGENFHSLSALTAVARYEEALARGESTFTTQLMGEVDGVTNGPMLTHLMLGAAGDVNKLFAMLNKGGFFELGSGHKNYNLWRSIPGNQDLYETTTAKMLTELNAQNQPVELLNALTFFTGNLGSPDKVEKAGRDIIKTPLTALVFGSSPDASIDSMASKFIESVYARMEDVAKGKANIQDLLGALNQLGIETPPDATIDSIMNSPLSTAQTNRLKGIFKVTIGEAVEATIKANFGTFLEQRKAYNKTAELAYTMYNAAYQAVRSAYIEELVSKGELPYRTQKNDASKRVQLADLTPAQYRELDKRMQGMLPVLQTAMSKESGDLSAGLVSMKREATTSKESVYENSVKFGTGIVGKSNQKGGLAESMTVRGMQRVPASPGVAMLPTAMHAADSYASHHAGEQVDSLNVHDARGAGVGQVHDVARALNQQTWNLMLNYSAPTEMANNLMRVIASGAKLVNDESVAKAMAEALTKFAEKNKMDPATVLAQMAGQAKISAYQADDLKLQALENMAFIDQYALEGGSYEVTDKDRAAAARLRSKLTTAFSASENAALDMLMNALAPHLDSKPTTQVKAPVGKPAVKSDASLTGFFQAKADRSINEVASQLGKMHLTGFQQKLLASMVKVLGTKADAYTVRYVTPTTTDILEQPKVPSHAWFVSKGNRNEIYILDSAFKDSGLTVETLLHEMVHATVARTIDTAANADVKALVQELEEVRSAATRILTQRKLNHLMPAVSTVQELVAWGMTNSEFQKVLDGIQMETRNAENRFITGLKSFIDSLVGLVFGKKNDAASTGMKVLVTNVAGLFKASSEQLQEGTRTLNQSMASGIQDLSTSELYTALASVGSTQVPSAFSTQLESLLTNIVDKIHGPFGAFKAQLTSTIQSPMDAWANAKATGKAPFAASVFTSGFNFSEQEAFVAEQVEAAMRAVLEDKDGSTTAAYRELVRLFDDAKDKLKPADFPSQQAYDFVFGVQLGADGKSTYLSRFAALGLANAQFNGMLQFHTPIRSESMEGMTIAERLHELFDRILAFINGKLTHTFQGQKANEKLTSLVQTLTDIESKKRVKLAHTPLAMFDMIDKAFQGASEGARTMAATVGNSALFQNSRSNLVKLAGTVATQSAQGRMGQWAQNIQSFRDAHLKERNGIAMGLVNEVRGATDLNSPFYKLLRLTKQIEGQRKDIITNTQQFVMESFKDGGKYLTQEMKKAVSAVLLRADVASLVDAYGMDDIARMMADTQYLDQQATSHEQQLAGFSDKVAYQNLAKLLAYKLATGVVKDRATLMNAENIARMYGTPRAGKVSEQDVAKATPIIDRLTTLYALQYLHQEAKGKPVEANHFTHLKEVFAQEMGRNDQGNGVAFVLAQHAFLQKDSKERLFNANGALAMKGYLPEVYNPYIRVVTADSRPQRDGQGNLLPSEGAELIEQGYSESDYTLPMDQADPEAHNGLKLYTIRDGGMVRYLSGIMSTTGTSAKGSAIHNGDRSLFSTAGMENRARMQAIQAKGQADMQRLLSQPIEPSKVNGTFAAPLLNNRGQVVNYRYLMSEQTKDTVLERDNRFDQLLGIMAGNIFDKEQSAIQNRKGIQALRDQYEADYKSNPKSYVRVGFNSQDPEMREIWQMLPDSTKQAIREIWGGNNMMVRYDMLDLNFGYRKLSLADPFLVPEAERNVAEKLYTEFFTFVFDKKAELRLRQGEEVWQALVKKAKDNMVVKSYTTLKNNFLSNISELIWFGVPITDIVKYHRVALKGVMAHRKDSAELARLQMQLDTGHLQGKSRSEVTSRVNQLKDSMARNPVRELIDAGLMPSIVEDVASEEDQYSFESKLNKKIDGALEQLNPHVLKVGKFVSIAHDTPLYQMLSYGTQVSDFLARYTLYQHKINQAGNPMDADTAVQLVSDAFINYDIPSHRGVQYANDMGLVYFSKYYLRIQKVIAMLYKEKPGRAMMMLTLGHYMDSLPLLTEAGALNHVGNPFSLGAFEAFRSMKDLATIKVLMTPFR